VRLEGLVFGSYLYATLLSKNLVPFGYQRLRLVALPVRLNTDNTLKVMEEHDFLSVGDIRSWQTWFGPAEQKWSKLKKDTTQERLVEWLNYHNKLGEQAPCDNFKIIYNGSGVHLAACVIDLHGSPPNVSEYPTQGFIADYKTYYFEAHDSYEAHFLCALLNAPAVDEAIKDYQSRGKGIVGQRDISRTPFEVCSIMPFDAGDPDHLELAQLSQEAHAVIADTEITGGVVKARRIARSAVAAQIEAIDEIARRILGL
jgi:hypothetical protein